MNTERDMPDPPDAAALEAVVAAENSMAAVSILERRLKEYERLGENEERFRLALGASPILVYSQDEDLRYSWVYSSHPKLPAETFLGHTDNDIFLAEEALRLFNLKQRVMQTGNPVKEAVEVTTAGEKFWLDVTIAPLGNSENQIIGITGVALDITGSKQIDIALHNAYNDIHSQSDTLRTLNEELRQVNEALMLSSVRQNELSETEEKMTARLKLLLDALPVGVLIAEDPEGRNITMNSAGYRMFNISAGEDISTGALFEHRFYHQGVELAPEEMPLLMAVLGDRDVQDMEVEVYLSGGRCWTGVFNATPLHNREDMVIGGIAVILDITRRRELEMHVTRLRREQESFLRHEIKNLFSPLQLFSEMLLQDTENLAQDQIHYLQRIAESAVRAADLINALQKIQNIEGGRFPLKRANHPLNIIIRQTISHLEPLAAKSGVTIRFNDPCENMMMPLDVDLMPGVFTNLIQNAIEHVAELRDPAEKAVTVDLTKQRGRYIIRINNRGTPVSPERLATFFDKFNAGPGKKTGTGLGTTYAYLVTKAHGGKITVSSGAKEGTTVTLIFPVS